MTAPARLDQPLTARQLYEEGLSLLAVADRLGVSYSRVRRELLRAGVTLRPARRPSRHASPAASGDASRSAPPRRHLHPVPDQAPIRSAPRPLMVAPERAAIAFTADRGWHMTSAPAGWLLDVIAEVEDG